MEKGGDDFTGIDSVALVVNCEAVYRGLRRRKSFALWKVLRERVFSYKNDERSVTRSCRRVDDVLETRDEPCFVPDRDEQLRAFAQAYSELQQGLPRGI